MYDVPTCSKPGDVDVHLHPETVSSGTKPLLVLISDRDGWGVCKSIPIFKVRD